MFWNKNKENETQPDASGAAPTGHGHTHGAVVGYPLADPIVELVITAAILRIVVETSKSVFARLLDGVEPEVLDEVRSVSSGTDGVKGVAEVRVRWLGHRMVAEVNIAVAPTISVEKGHAIAQEVHHNLLHHLRYLSSATIHVDPEGSTWEEHHQHSNYHQGEEDQHGHLKIDGHEHDASEAGAPRIGEDDDDGSDGHAHDSGNGHRH